MNTVSISFGIKYLLTGHWFGKQTPGVQLNIKCPLTNIGIPMIKIRQFHDCLIFIMRIPISGKIVLGESVSTYRCRLTSIGIPMLKVRLSHDRLIFNMGIPIPGKTVFILRRGPGYQHGLYVLFPSCLLLLCLANAASTDCFQESYRYCHMDEHCRKCYIALGITVWDMSTETNTITFDSVFIYSTIILGERAPYRKCESDIHNLTR